MKQMGIAVLLIVFVASALPQAKMSAKTAKAVIDDRITAKVAVIGEIDGITLRLKEANVFFVFNNCEKDWKRHWFRNWVEYRSDPCKAELRKIALSLN